ncbi:MAG: tRNA pseudouridine(38-40) synthase TruA [Thermoplasmata archaeon]|nr:MAG: tRNA pseudouridine(38-40) synthase TruA [Thermoplasmata archaeon]
MRLALKIAYDGRAYHGYARQPHIKTIEGEIINALKKAGAIENVKDAQLHVASRTDKGVSAWGNVIAFNTSMKKDSLINALSHIFDNIWIIAYASVPKNFHPRYAKQRKYRYYLINDGLDIKKMRKAAKLFIGEHDFSNFAKIENKNPVRKIDNIIIYDGPIIKMDFIAKTFLWHQVRRIVSAIEKVGRGMSIEEIESALAGKKKTSFGIAPPENLVLVDVSYPKSLNFHYLNHVKNILKVKKNNAEKEVMMLNDMEKFLFEKTCKRNK